MLKLIGDDFSLTVQEDNPLYKNLQKFVGEQVLIYREALVVKETENVKEEKVQEKPQVKNYGSVNKEKVFNQFYEAFNVWHSMDEENQPIVYKLLENHLTQVLGTNFGDKQLEKVEENTYKAGELYLIV